MKYRPETFLFRSIAIAIASDCGIFRKVSKRKRGKNRMIVSSSSSSSFSSMAFIIIWWYAQCLALPSIESAWSTRRVYRIKIFISKWLFSTCFLVANSSPFSSQMMPKRSMIIAVATDDERPRSLSFLVSLTSYVYHVIHRCVHSRARRNINFQWCQHININRFFYVPIYHGAQKKKKFRISM